MTTAIRFEPVTTNNLRAFVRITRETLWHPVWPGDEAVAADFRRWSPEIQQGARLIYEGRELIGRVVAPQFEHYLVLRDLGVRSKRGLAQRVGYALISLAERQQANTIRAILQEPLWLALSALGFVEQKRRTTMRKSLRHTPATIATANVRHVASADGDSLGELMYDAYVGTADDEGEDLDLWTRHVGDVMRGQYGRFLPEASFVTPTEPPFDSATLVIESARYCAVLGQVVTRHTHTNRGYARRLISYSLAALAQFDYEHCFLEVTLSNANAIHLYHALGFEPVGPQIVYGIKSLP